MSETLKPCPFCGETEGVTLCEHGNTPRWYFVHCNCGATGSDDLGRSGAIEVWNTRQYTDAAIQRGDTYRARARALRRQAKAWRITYRIMSDISCSVDPGSTRNIKRAMRLP